MIYSSIRPRQIVLALVATVFVVEYLAYYLHRSIFWPHLPCSSTAANCTRLLLVADPQILGETFDRNGYAWWARRDSDRYLRVTFAHALAHHRPHAVLFLGDLMDEGSVADAEQFERYAGRFETIYGTAASLRRDYGGIEAVHAAGDNDIGGESPADVVTEEKVQRFGERFNAAGWVDVAANRTRVVNLNLLRSGRIIEREALAERTPAGMWRVVMTHMSLLAYPGVSERVSRQTAARVEGFN